MNNSLIILFGIILLLGVNNIKAQVYFGVSFPGPRFGVSLFNPPFSSGFPEIDEIAMNDLEMLQNAEMQQENAIKVNQTDHSGDNATNASSTAIEQQALGMTNVTNPVEASGK